MIAYRDRQKRSLPTGSSGFSSEMFHEPASVKDIAAALTVTEAAVKHHVGDLYDNYGLHTEKERRRVELANSALRRGPITPRTSSRHRERETPFRAHGRMTPCLEAGEP